MTLELCELSSINNDTLDYHCDVDFKAKVGRLSRSVESKLTAGMDLWRIQCDRGYGERTRADRDWYCFWTLVRYYGVLE